MEAAGDPSAELNMLVEALSEMAKPYGYTVTFRWDGGLHAFLGMTDNRGVRAGYLCAAYSENIDSREAAAAAVVSRYGGCKSWTYWDIRRNGWLSMPGGSPEELALKAAAGVRAVLVSR